MCKRAQCEPLHNVTTPAASEKPLSQLLCIGHAHVQARTCGCAHGRVHTRGRARLRACASALVRACVLARVRAGMCSRMRVCARVDSPPPAPPRAARRARPGCRALRRTRPSSRALKVRRIASGPALYLVLLRVVPVGPGARGALPRDFVLDLALQNSAFPRPPPARSPPRRPCTRRSPGPPGGSRQPFLNAVAARPHFFRCSLRARACVCAAPQRPVEHAPARAHVSMCVCVGERVCARATIQKHTPASHHQEVWETLARHSLVILPSS